ncbi:MAG: hypothetical protein WCG25_05200 [bacterium]
MSLNSLITSHPCCTIEEIILRSDLFKYRLSHHHRTAIVGMLFFIERL